MTDLLPAEELHAYIAEINYLRFNQGSYRMKTGLEGMVVDGQLRNNQALQFCRTSPDQG